MKSMKMMGFFAMALTALSCVLPGTVNAAGHIRSIDLVTDSTDPDVIKSASEPMKAGQKVQFKIRLRNHDCPTIESSGEANPWDVRPLAGRYYDKSEQKIGVWVSGGLREAQIVSCEPAVIDGSVDKYHTDVIFEYVAKEGDYAQPIKLANSAGTGPAKDGHQTGGTLIPSAPESSDYYLFNNTKWGFFPRKNAADDYTNRAEFYFGPDVDRTYSFAASYEGGETRDYDLSGLNVKIGAIDFDNAREDEGVDGFWRTIQAGTSTALPEKPAIAIPGGSSSPYKYYVWTKNANVAEVEGGTDYLFADGVTRKVAMLQVNKNDTSVNFSILAKDNAHTLADPTTEVYFSDTPTNIFDNANDLIVNFRTKKIKVIDPPQPSYSVKLTQKVATATTNHDVSVVALDVVLNQVWTKDVKIKVTPQMAGGEDWKNYIGMSVNQSGPGENIKQDMVLTVKAGHKSAVESGYMLHIYANRANSKTEGGITFVPSIDESTADYADAQTFFQNASPTADTLTLKHTNPVITGGTKDYNNVAANVEWPFSIKIADSKWNISPNDALGTQPKFKVFFDEDGSGDFQPISDLTAVADGEGGFDLTFNHKYQVGGTTYNSKFYVVNQDGYASHSKDSPFEITVKVNPIKEIILTCDSATKRYCEGEQATINIKFSEPFKGGSGDGYVFLTPDEKTRELIDWPGVDSGMIIGVGDTQTVDPATFTLLNGYKNCTLKFTAEVRSTDDNTSGPGNLISAWSSKGITLYVTNSVPTIDAVNMNGFSVTKNEGVFEVDTAIGVNNIFSVEATDMGVDDISSNKFTTVMTIFDGSNAQTFKFYGNPYEQTANYVFNTMGQKKITVYSYDADMDSTDQKNAKNNPFTVFVNVNSAPSVSLESMNGSQEFLESQVGELGRIKVKLNVAPAGLPAGKTVDVKLSFVRLGSDSEDVYPLPVLNTNIVHFANGEDEKVVNFKELDGTPATASDGFILKAEVITGVEGGKDWSSYYRSSENFEIKVKNESPENRIYDAGNTNAIPVAINVPTKIRWNASDVCKADLKEMSITWSGNDINESYVTNLVGASSSLYQEVTFTSSGEKRVTLTITDKDGGYNTYVYVFYVNPSKELEIYPRQPNRARGASGAVSSFSSKFTQALGIGDGRVWAEVGVKPSSIKNFVQNWAYSPEDLSTKVNARGYKYVDGVGEIDNGTLTGGLYDFPVDKNGNAVAMGLSDDNYYQFGNIKKSDSFFYCWIYNTSSGEGGGYTGTHLGSPTPQLGTSAMVSAVNVTLPEYDESTVTYPKTLVEAIFSLEYRNTDNLGDINQDGIPDVYAASATWGQDGSHLFEAAGGELDGDKPGDLTMLGNFNEDIVTVNSLVNNDGSGDFLPSMASSGISIIPNLYGWANKGSAFTAKLELRGMHEGLNYRASDSGKNRNVRGMWISTPDFSDAEWVAIAHMNPEAGIDLTSSEDWENDVATLTEWIMNNEDSWIPENRTDPTVDDTDEDGFPDGYEYYFWYKAMVGEWDAASKKWTRAEGSRFTLDDIATGVKITPEEIAAAFNPTVATAADAIYRDTDNDGLTDLEELAMGTNPIHWDSDGDGISDYWEIMNGMSPVSAKEDDGAAMNVDNDYMARYDSPKEYTIATFDLGGGKVKEFAFSGPASRYFDTETKALKEDIATNDAPKIVAIEVFRYGKAGSGTCVPCFRGGKVKNMPDHEGEEVDAKPLDALVCDITDVVSASVKFVENQSVSIIHDQVYYQFGFDPRTAWNNEKGYVSERWKPTADTADKGKSYLGEAGAAVNTVKYTALDEYLLLKYRYETKMPGFSIKSDKDGWGITPNGRKCSDVFLKGTTAPYVQFDNLEWISNAETKAEVDFHSKEGFHGCDTDGDGVPDGWELYVLANPNDGSEKDTADADGDKLTLAEEFAGTDSCNVYSTEKEGSGYAKIYDNHPGKKTGWYNKFFPTDPRNSDTDGDGISDSDEGATWESVIVWGNGATEVENLAERKYVYSFIYGDEVAGEGDEKTSKPSADDGTTCIRGGGLNPCSVDTDGDLLPDPWERQFAGVLFGPDGKPTVEGAFSDGELKLIRRSDALNGDARGYYISAGMDGTWGKDSWTDITETDPRTGTTRDYDFDHDGLQNFQEYLVQALRHLRYDDSDTPLMGQYMIGGNPASLSFVKFLPMNIMDGEKFYQDAKAAGFPGTGAWKFRELGYFARPAHEWDRMALCTKTKGRVNYDEMGYRLMLPPCPNETLGKASGYVSTDPRNQDSDADGMDDYYELFHGLNPILGNIQDPNADLISVAYGAKVKATANAWTGFSIMDPPVFDAMRYPWLIGTPGCDADGDGLNNYDEALYANMTNPQTTHTDPTPLWMTDSTIANKASFTAQYYRGDCDQLIPDLLNYWPMGSDNACWMFSFEENEGYDTDHDGINDSEEKLLTSSEMSDPLNFSDPARRQAIWFPGNNSAAVSYNCAPANRSDVNFDTFRQFTVEAWVNPENVMADQVILERAVDCSPNTLSNNVKRIRANFRLGITNEGRIYGLLDSADAVETGTFGTSATVLGPKVPEAEWSHVALTYNGTSLAIYLNGTRVGMTQTTLIPANGITSVIQQPLPDGKTFPAGNTYLRSPSAMVLGATALDAAAISLGESSTWASFGKFFTGYIDEVRVWDGAKSEGEVADEYKKRFTLADALENRNEVYRLWNAGATRNQNDGNDTLPVELVFHYNFSTIPGALNEADVMNEPSGFKKNVIDNVRIGGQAISGGLYCGWLNALPVKSDVYLNYRWVPWIPNMVSHLPAIDGTVADSKYWGELLAGNCFPNEALNLEDAQRFVFSNTMNPYTIYHNCDGNDEISYNNRLAIIADTLGNTNASNSANVSDKLLKLNKFAKLRASVGAMDLIPLGGAFAKRTTKMWDNLGAADAWTYTKRDSDANGMPDWWQQIYGLTADSTWEAIVTRDGEQMTAREAFIRDMAAGMTSDGVCHDDYKSMIDANRNGIPDWWENLYGIKDEPAEADHDGDGLSNYAEYLIGECFARNYPGDFGHVRVRPDQARTYVEEGQLVPDYFLKVGSLYLGEMFADHDFCEDTWEDAFALPVGFGSEALYASRYVNDMWEDNDGDGWSNWAESRVASDPTRIYSVSFLYDDFPEYPIPTVRANIRYNGSQVTTGAGLVLRAFSKSSPNGRPDATWFLGGSAESGEADKAAGGKDKDKIDVGTEIGAYNDKIIGMNPGTDYKFNLGTGKVVPGTVRILFRDLNSICVDEDGVHNLSAGESVWTQGLSELYRGHETTSTSIILSKDDETEVGRVNYETGDVEINFSKLPKYLYTSDDGYNGYGWTRPENLSGYYRLNASNSFVRVVWRSPIVASANTWSASLAKATAGYLREGKATFEAFLDIDNDGAWTPGEPFGVAADVDVGYALSEVNVELTDVNPSTMRINLLEATQANDFESQKTLNDRGMHSSQNYGANSYLYDIAIGKNMPDSWENEARIRIVRSSVSGVQQLRTAYGIYYADDSARLDVTRDLRVNQVFSERDVLDSGSLDLDWGAPLEQAAKSLGVDYQNITNATYRIVIGNGTVSPLEPTNNNSIATVIVNVFEEGAKGAQSRCVPVAPKGTLYSAQPTFKWTHQNTIGKAYPAFQLRVWNGATCIYDSGAQRAPVRDIDGVYSWTAPIYAGMTTPQGHVFSTTNNYTWSVSMLDAKFTTPNSTETKQTFRMETSGALGTLSDYGTISAKVHYFGAVTPSVDAATLKNMIRVQAFSSHDFSGMPVCEGRVSELVGLTNGVGSVVTLAGVPAGTYYVRAFLDTDADTKFSKWESWGYACNVSRLDAGINKFSPKGIKLEKGKTAPEAEIFIEDMDCDNDGLPDAWEWNNNNSLDAKSSPSGNTFFTKVNPNLAATLAAYTNLMTGDDAAPMMYSPMLLMSMLTADDPSAAIDVMSLARVEVPAPSRLKGASQDAKTFIAVRIEDFSLNDGATVSVSTEVDTLPEGGILVSADTAAVSVYVIASASVDFANATTIKVKTLDIKANDTTTIKVTPEELNAAIEAAGVSSSAFFKVKLVK